MKVHLVSTSRCFNVFSITVKAEDRETYQLPQFFPTRDAATKFAANVILRGVINPEHWVKITSQGVPISVKGMFGEVRTEVVAAEKPRKASKKKAA